MFSTRLSVTTSYQKLSSLLETAGLTGILNNSILEDTSLIRNTNTAETLYVALGYASSPTSNVGAVAPGGVIKLSNGLNTNEVWVKSSSALSADIFIGAEDYVNQYNVLSSDLTVNGNEVVTGTLAVTGASTLTGATTVTGLLTTNGFSRDAGTKRVSANVTNATATMADLTDLSVTLVAGRKYVGEMVVKCSDSTAAEGISFDFDGGTATMTSFAAGAGVLTGGTTVAVTTTSTAIATDLNWTTITGETWIIIKLSLVVNAGGTLIPRMCQGTAHSAGTATVNLGTFLRLEDAP